MKKILFIAISFLFLIHVKAQHPIGTDSLALQTLGNSNTFVKSKGVIGADSGIVIAAYADTTAANLGKLKNYPGAIIHTGDLFWMRNTDATAWISMAVLSINVPSDSTDFLDSTGQPQFRNLYSLPGHKIGSSPWWLVDTPNHRIIVNDENISFASNTDKLAVNGRAYLKGLKLDIGVLGTRTNTYNYTDPSTKVVGTDTFAVLKVVDETGGTSRLRSDTLYVNPLTSGGGTTTNALTMNNSGSGDVSGSTFDGSAAKTISYNTIGAVPTSRTINGTALSSNVTLTLASSQFANQGTTTTVLHGNASGNPSFGSIVNADITNATIVASTKLSATGTPSANAVLLGNDTWGAPFTLTTTGSSGAATFSSGTLNIPQYSGGGSAVDTSSMININLWSGLGLTDNRKFQYATDYARIRGKIVFAGWNNDRNSRTFYFDSAVLYQSHCNYYFYGCTIKNSDSSRDNLFRSANCGYGITNPFATAYTDVSWTGAGWAIEGADNPRSSGDAYATLSTTPTILNGFTYGRDASVTGQSHHGDWRNNLIQGCNVSNVLIAGGTIRNSAAYGITFGHSSNVLIDRMTAENNGYANGDTARRMANEGTIDFHQGWKDITVSNCTGFSQDDFLAFNITNNTDSTAGHLGYYPEGDSATAAFDSGYNYTAYNIAVGSNANTIRTLIPPGSFHANNMRFYNIVNTLKPTDPFYGRQNGTQASAIKIGDIQTGFYGGNISMGQWTNITADNIRTLNTKYLIWIPNRIQDARFSNLYKPSALATPNVYYDGAFADHKDVTVTNDWDATNKRMVMANIGNMVKLSTDSANKIYSTTTSNAAILLARWDAATTFGESAGNAMPAGGISASTAFGSNAMLLLSSAGGTNNTAVGNRALHNDVSGANNTAVGSSALDSATGANNTAVGYAALLKNTSDFMTAVGSGALASNTSGTKNTAVGYNALTANTTTNENTAFGYAALSTAATASFNTAIGSASLQVANSSSGRNTAVGARTGDAITSGTSNVIVGFEAGHQFTTGAGNLLFGDDAGYNLHTSDSKNIIMGYDNEGVSGWSNKFAVDLANNGTNDFLYGDMTSTTNRYLKVNAGFANAYAAKTGTYAVTNADHTIDCTSGTFTVTLPTAANVTGIEYEIVNSGSGTITIATTSSQTFVNINATPTTLTLAAVGAGAIVEYTVRSNGANWIVVGKVKNE